MQEDLVEKEIELKGYTTLSDAIVKAAAIVVGYMFISSIIGSLMTLRYVWWIIVFSYIAAIVGAVAYCLAKSEEYDFFITQIKKKK
tara:strand:+ start:687 stop:944 length:258 start_codon:yes stop_codon:yes gene_type:complete